MKIETLNFTAMNDKERFEKILIYTNMNVRQLGIHLGLKQIQSLYDLKNGKISMPKNIAYKIKEKFQDLNLSWILAGEGEMLGKVSTTQTITTNNGLAVANNGGSINYHTSGDDYEVPYTEPLPVVPPTIVRQAGVDILEYVRENMSRVEKSSVVVNDMELTTWIPMPDDCMAPEIQKGDRLGLWAYPRGHENPIPGKIYAVDTMSNGTIVRYLFITPEGDYLLRSQNPQLYPDFVVKKSDVIAIYKKLISVRI